MGRSSKSGDVRTLPDQAALHGVLAEFAWLGLELLGIRRLPKLPESGDAN